MPSYEQRYDAARDKFFAENPAARAQVESVSASVIEACGLTVDDYRDQQRIAVFAEAAQKLGLDTDEFVIRLVAESPEQAQEWRERRHRRIADALGLEWDEYLKMNRISE